MLPAATIKEEEEPELAPTAVEAEVDEVSAFPDVTCISSLYSVCHKWRVSGLGVTLPHMRQYTSASRWMSAAAAFDRVLILDTGFELQVSQYGTSGLLLTVGGCKAKIILRMGERPSL